MPECVVCGLDDFEERDGLYFCTTCQTQTQDLIHEEEEIDEHAEASQALVDRRLQIKQKAQKAAKTKELEFKGRPWTIYEAYQIILKHQVQAFIRLGAHPKLEDFVFRLWAVYLSKLQVAFTKDEQLYPQVLKKHARHREKYYGSLENPITPASRNIRRHRRMKVTGSAPPVVVEGEEFYEGDDPTQSLEGDDKYFSTSEEEEEEERDIVEDDDDDDSVYGDKDVKPKTTINRVLATRVEWASLPKLLSLCYLGLLYTNSATTAADVIRWVEEGEIPYVEVSILLPDEFQFGSYDPQLFSAQIPKPHALRQLTGNLAYFLDITTLPPVPVSQLVSRYILLLHLPADLHGLVMSVMSQHPPQCQFVIKSAGASASLPFFDALAMAFIILTLKLWLGLDDCTEKELSCYSREVMELIEGKHGLFVFDDWKTHITRKLAKTKAKTSLFSPGDVTEVSDIDGLLESYYRSKLHQRRPPRYYMKQNKGGDYNRYQQSTKEDLARPFKLAAEKMKKASDQGQGHSQDQSNTKQIERDKFIQCSMKHITNPVTFLDDLDRHNLSDDTLYSSCVESEDDDNKPSICTSMETMSIDSFGESSAPRPKRQRSAAKEAVRQVFKKVKSNKQPSQELQSKMVDLRQKCVCASKQFVMYKRILLKDRTCSLEAYRHRSYCWLVNLCSQIVRCSPYELDVFVLQLSNVLFSFNSQKFNLLKPDIKKFKDKYFAERDSE